MIFLTNKIFILLQRLKIKSHLIKIIFDFVRILFDFILIIFDFILAKSNIIYAPLSTIMYMSILIQTRTYLCSPLLVHFATISHNQNTELVSVIIYIGMQTKNPHSKRMWTYMNNILVKIFSLRGLFQIRTGVNGFADRHLATRSRDHAVLRLQNYKVFRYYKNFSAFFYKKLLIILFGYSLYN